MRCLCPRVSVLPLRDRMCANWIRCRTRLSHCRMDMLRLQCARVRYAAEYRLFYGALVQKRRVILRSLLIEAIPQWIRGVSIVGILQHTATHCNTLQHTATHCNTLQHTATRVRYAAYPLCTSCIRCRTRMCSVCTSHSCATAYPMRTNWIRCCTRMCTALPHTNAHELDALSHTTHVCGVLLPLSLSHTLSHSFSHTH